MIMREIIGLPPAVGTVLHAWMNVTSARVVLYTMSADMPVTMSVCTFASKLAFTYTRRKGGKLVGGSVFNH
jgi:hypothetical protein